MHPKIDHQLFLDFKNSFINFESYFKLVRNYTHADKQVDPDFCTLIRNCISTALIGIVSLGDLKSSSIIAAAYHPIFANAPSKIIVQFGNNFAGGTALHTPYK